MIRRSSLALAAVLLAGTAFQGIQAATLITNGSFEQAVPGSTPPSDGQPLTSSNNPLLGWSILGPEVAWLHSGAFGVQTPYESYFLDLTGYGSTGGNGVSQTIMTTPNQGYTLTFSLGYNNNTGERQGPVSAQAIAGLQTGLFVTTGLGDVVTTPDGSTWQSFSLSFLATSTTTDISIIGSGTAGDLIGLDNVAVAAFAPSPVPLPASAPLFGVSLVALGCAGYGLKRRKASLA